MNYPVIYKTNAVQTFGRVGIQADSGGLSRGPPPRLVRGQRPIPRRRPSHDERVQQYSVDTFRNRGAKINKKKKKKRRPYGKSFKMAALKRCPTGSIPRGKSGFPPVDSRKAGCSPLVQFRESEEPPRELALWKRAPSPPSRRPSGPGHPSGHSRCRAHSLPLRSNRAAVPYRSARGRPLVPLDPRVKIQLDGRSTVLARGLT